MKRLFFAVGVSLLAAAGRAFGADTGYTPFVLGTLNGWPADVVLLNGGGSGGAFAARVFVDDGARGVVDLGVVNAEGGDGLNAFFSDGTLYFTNRARLPGECHTCASHVAVQRLHLRNHKLVNDGVITVDAPTTQSYASYISEIKLRATVAYKKRGY